MPAGQIRVVPTRDIPGALALTGTGTTDVPADFRWINQQFGRRCTGAPGTSKKELDFYGLDSRLTLCLPGPPSGRRVSPGHWYGPPVKPRVLVTGAGGSAGRAVAAQLKARGVPVLGTDVRELPAGSGITAVRVPLASDPELVSALRRLEIGRASCRERV